MGMAVPIYYSADMVRTLPEDGNRYETVHGELLVTPAPRLWHQAVVRRLLVALDAYLEKYHVGEVLSSPADISIPRVVKGSDDTTCDHSTVLDCRSRREIRRSVDA